MDAPHRKNDRKLTFVLLGFFFFAWLFCYAATSGQTPPITIPTVRSHNLTPNYRNVPRDDFVEVNYQEGWAVYVHRLTGTSLQRVRVFDCPEHHTLVFVGPPGSYVVAALSVQGNEYFEYVRIIDGVTPGPDPPGPDPDPDPPGPGPTPPPDPDVIPSDLSNTYGIGKPSYIAAKKINNPTQARELGLAYMEAIRQLGAGSSLDAAELVVRGTRESFGSGWSSWEAAVEPAVNLAIDKYGTSINAVRRYYYEIAKSLEAASK